MSERRPTSAALAPAPERVAAGRVPAPLRYRPIAASMFQGPLAERWPVIATLTAGVAGVVATPLVLIASPFWFQLVVVGLLGSSTALALELAAPLWWRARLWRVPSAVGAPLDGQTVRVRGTVQSQTSTFDVPGGATPGVYARTRYFPFVPAIGTPIAGQDETRGVSFQVQL